MELETPIWARAKASGCDHQPITCIGQTLRVFEPAAALGGIPEQQSRKPNVTENSSGGR